MPFLASPDLNEPTSGTLPQLHSLPISSMRLAVLDWNTELDVPSSGKIKNIAKKKENIVHKVHN